jgi:Flp pilus assembly CpaE family ATPase
LLHILGLEVPLEIWLNAWDQNSTLTLSEVSDYLGTEVHGTLPVDVDAVNRSINEGRPLTETDPHHPLCQALQTRADKLAGKEILDEAMASGWGWLKRLTGKA